MAKSPKYNKDAVDKQLTKNGVVKPKAKALTHKLLKGHQKTNESGPFTKDIVNFSMFAGMYSDGAHAFFQGRDGKTHKVQATSDRPRKYYLDGKEISWDDLKRVAGRTIIHPKQGFDMATDESMQEDGASDAERNPSIERDKYRNRHPGPSAADREKAQIDRDRKAGMNMDPMDILKRKKERAMWGESVAVTTGDTDAWTQGHVAGKKGKGTNPHKAGSKDAKEWDKGFAHAKKTVKDTVNEISDQKRKDYIAKAQKDYDDNWPGYISYGKKDKDPEGYERKKAHNRKLRNREDGIAAAHRAMTNYNESKNLTEGVLDDMDDDGFMAKRQLYDIAKYAVALHKMIQDTDNLEPWIQAKITKAQDYIDTVKHYLEYGQMRDAEDTADVMGPPNMGDIDAVGSELDAMMPQQEAVMEFGDEDEGSEVYGEDVLRWAANRGIISNEQYDSPTYDLIGAAEDVAQSIGPVWEIGSSDVSIWLRDFVQAAKGYGIALEGPRAHLYESEIKATKIYSKMLKELRKK